MSTMAGEPWDRTWLQAEMSRGQKGTHCLPRKGATAWALQRLLFLTASHQPLSRGTHLLTLSVISKRLAEMAEKAMAPHSSTLAWKIPWTEEPGGLQSMGLRRVGHDWATSLSLVTFMHGRRKWQPTPVFLPGESQGQGSLVGCCLWGHRESDTTEAT